MWGRVHHYRDSDITGQGKLTLDIVDAGSNILAVCGVGCIAAAAAGRLLQSHSRQAAPVIAERRVAATWGQEWSQISG